MKKSKLDIINKLLCLLLIISTIVGVIILPEKVPIHFNANSDITNYGSKCINIIMGALLLSIILGLNIYTNALNKKISENPFEKNKKNTKPYEYVNLSIALFFNIYNIYIIHIQYASMNDKTHLLSRDISKFLLLSIGCLFIFFAYIIPKSKLNSVVGVRTTWSKKNELIWEKTQRFSGIAFGVTGIILIIGAIVFSKKVALIFMITIIVICVIISCTMSYYIYKKCINNKRL